MVNKTMFILRFAPKQNSTTATLAEVAKKCTMSLNDSTGTRHIITKYSILTNWKYLNAPENLFKKFQKIKVFLPLGITSYTFLSD